MELDWYDIGNKIKNAKPEELMDRIRENVESFVTDEREYGKSKMTAALHDAGTDDEEIVRLLQKYYELTENEAMELLRLEKTQDEPCRRVIDYLIMNEGYSRSDAVSFISDYEVSELLRDTKCLWKKSAEEIIRIAREKQAA